MASMPWVSHVGKGPAAILVCRSSSNGCSSVLTLRCRAHADLGGTHSIWYVQYGCPLRGVALSHVLPLSVSFLCDTVCPCYSGSSSWYVCAFLQVMYCVDVFSRCPCGSLSHVITRHHTLSLVISSHDFVAACLLSI